VHKAYLVLAEIDRLLGHHILTCDALIVDRKVRCKAVELK
jgi:hypothetical protein